MHAVDVDGGSNQLHDRLTGCNTRRSKVEVEIAGKESERYY